MAVTAAIESARTWVPNLAVDRHRHLIVLAYAAMAAVLVPWIAVIVLTQPSTSIGHHLALVVSGSAAFVTVCVLLMAFLVRTQVIFLAMTATATAAGGFIVTWFHSLVRSGTPPVNAYIVESALIPAMALSVWIAVRASRRTQWQPAGWLSPLFLLAGVICTIGTVRLALVTPAVREGDHLNLVWTGLDVFELLTLAGTAWACHRRSATVEVWATAAATWLLADAWFNIVPSIGVDRLLGIAMALVEMPLAALSLWLAWPSVVAVAE